MVEQHYEFVEQVLVLALKQLQWDHHRVEVVAVDEYERSKEE